jgi:hypothetical protein
MCLSSHIAINGGAQTDVETRQTMCVLQRNNAAHSSSIFAVEMHKILYIFVCARTGGRVHEHACV